MNLAIQTAIKSLRSRAEQQKIRRQALKSQVESLTTRLEAENQRLQLLHEARQVFIECARIARQQTISDVEALVSSALAAIFNRKDKGFVVRVQEKRSVLTADFFIRDLINGQWMEKDPLYYDGGSVVDVVTAALHLVFLKKYRPLRRQILVLDEPGRMLDPVKRERYARWLRRVSHEMGVQLIIVTHDPELKAVADRRIQLYPHPDLGVRVQVEDKE